MPKPYPREFRENVVAVARQGDEGIAQIAKDFGIAESCLRNWLAAADAQLVGPEYPNGRQADPWPEELARAASVCLPFTTQGRRRLPQSGSSSSCLPRHPLLTVSRFVRSTQ
jgi:transposase-like protein